MILTARVVRTADEIGEKRWIEEWKLGWGRRQAVADAEPRRRARSTPGAAKGGRCLKG